MAETLPEFLFHWAERAPDATFLGEPDRDRCYAYSEVAVRVARFRARLRALGVTRGDRVAIVADNGVGWVVAYLGAIAHGAVAVPLNTRHAAGDLDRALGDFEPAAIVGDPAYLGRLSDRYRQRAIDLAAAGPARAAAAVDGSEARPDELGILAYTSGTTGQPRGVMVRNASLVRNAAMFAQLFQSGPDSATAVVCPLFHNTGFNDGLAHMLLVGGRADVPRRFEPGPVARALREAR
jgi:acyl-CoA synthetase (AMP-forming)/AMP-acid ligase II